MKDIYIYNEGAPNRGHLKFLMLTTRLGPKPTPLTAWCPYRLSLFMGWSDNHFNNLRFIISLETTIST